MSKSLASSLPTSGIGLRDKIGYALGDMGGLLTFGIIGAFLQMFYTDVLHLPLNQITVLMLVARIWDALNDPMWGTFVDTRKPSRLGKFRPYLLWGSLPLALACVLSFLRVPGLSQNQYLVYAYITYIFYGMMYTFVTIPYGSLASVITDNEYERTDLSVFRSIGGGIGNLPGQVLLPLFVYSTAVDTGVKYLDGNKLFAAVAIVAGCSLIAYYFSFRLTTERIPAPEQPPKLEFGKTLRALITNRPFIVVCLTSALLLGVTMYSQTLNNYLFKNYFQQPKLYSIVSISTYAPMLFVLPFVGKLVKRFGIKNLCAVGIGFTTIVSFALWLLRVQNPTMFIVMCFLNGLGLSFITIEIWALAADVIDYHEFRTHKREEATCYAYFSFMRKLGQTLAGSGASIALSAIGYDVTNTMQLLPQEALDGMYTMATLVPALVYGIMFLLITVLYPLGKERTSEMHRQLIQTRIDLAD